MNLNLEKELLKMKQKKQEQKKIEKELRE